MPRKVGIAIRSCTRVAQISAVVIITTRDTVSPIAAPSRPRPSTKMKRGSVKTDTPPEVSVTYIARLPSPSARRAPLATMPMTMMGSDGTVKRR